MGFPVFFGVPLNGWWPLAREACKRFVFLFFSVVMCRCLRAKRACVDLLDFGFAREARICVVFTRSRSVDLS